MFRRSASITITAIVALLLNGCGPAGENPAHIARELAKGLQTGDLAEVSFEGVPPEVAQSSLLESLGGLVEVSREVTVGEVREVGGGRAEATLQYTWDVPTEEDWSYEATVALVKSNADWLVEWSPQIIEGSLSDGEKIEFRPVPAERGHILDGSGEALVLPRAVRRVGISKNEVAPEQWETAARLAADVVGIDPEAYVEKVTAYGPEAFVEAITLRENAFQALNYAKASAVPGWTALTDELPLAPSSSFARPILGSVREATAEDIQTRGNDIAPQDMLGAGGIQETYDQELRGEPRWDVLAIEKESGANRLLHRTEPRPGLNIKTSLHRELQIAAEETLTTSENSSPAALVAIKPSTGAILAAANGPSDNSYNTAFLGNYAPGSTFKAATALALLRDGASPESPVDCSPQLEAAGRYFQNAGTFPPDYFGQITLREAIAQSCNTALIATHETVTQPDLAGAAASLGIGNPINTGLPTFTGNVPVESDDPTEHAAMMIGQGKVLTSPLAMATLMGTISHGETIHPWIVENASATPEPSPPFMAEEADQLQSLLRSVVTDGHLKILLDIPGGPVMGKTGTAEFGSESPLRTHSWVIAAQDDLAVAVFVEDGDYGSVTGGPMMREFLLQASQIDH